MAFGSALPSTIDDHDARKARGAFFTPSAIADSITRFAITSKEDRVLEPSCGEAEFLVSAARRLMSLGASQNDVDRQLHGNELHRQSADAAMSRMNEVDLHPEITVGDFFDAMPSEHRFDAVIGNPPYIRYQDFAGQARAKAREAAFATGVRISALASSWAPFVVHATRFLASGGRLGFVLPAELLTVQYAAPVRRYLLEHFARVEVILFENHVFPEVQEEVVLLLASGFDRGRSAYLFMSQVCTIDELSSTRPFVTRVDTCDRWPIGKAFRDAQAMLAQLDPTYTTTLGAYGEIHLGAVSGSNKFFALSADRARELGLEQTDVTRICPPGSHHLRTLSLSNTDLDRLSAAGKATLLFSPQANPSKAARSYIAYGEEIGVSKAYKCRIRTPWWRVPGLRTCDLFLTYMNGAGPNLCRNDAHVPFLNSVHGVFLNDETPRAIARLLPAAALSTITLLSAELVGRSYGGGILKLEPREASQMVLPAAELVLAHASELNAIHGALSGHLSRGERDEATLMVDDILLPDLGMSRSDMRLAHGSLLELRARRYRRGTSPSTR